MRLYLKGEFDDDDQVLYARPPPDFPGGSKYRRFDERGVALVWLLKRPLIIRLKLRL